ncbi:hypothetical protein CH063_11307 [Colletotrichum higginsianum]|uniref:Uncharacterized protein n=1 Tax=Colletotrichum higginsianum (strain IMI 349063) TaxID=759273 RepID=H1VKU3_COLHI|nr:hypothetical protein CH063_11307 [Colletotrichum higginsianum]
MLTCGTHMLPWASYCGWFSSVVVSEKYACCGGYDAVDDMCVSVGMPPNTAPGVECDDSEDSSTGGPVCDGTVCGDIGCGDWGYPDNGGGEEEEAGWPYGGAKGEGTGLRCVGGGDHASDMLWAWYA